MERVPFAEALGISASTLTNAESSGDPLDDLRLYMAVRVLKDHGVDDVEFDDLVVDGEKKVERPAKKDPTCVPTTKPATPPKRSAPSRPPAVDDEAAAS